MNGHQLFKGFVLVMGILLFVCLTGLFISLRSHLTLQDDIDKEEYELKTPENIEDETTRPSDSTAAISTDSGKFEKIETEPVTTQAPENKRVKKALKYPLDDKDNDTLENFSLKETLTNNKEADSIRL